MRRTRPTKSIFQRRSVWPLRFVLALEGADRPLRRIGSPCRQKPNRSCKMETAIRVDSDVTTLVNVFTLEPDNQPKALTLLRESVETLFSKMPGWISSSLLKSRDGSRVVVYSQWRD